MSGPNGPLPPGGPYPPGGGPRPGMPGPGGPVPPPVPPQHPSEQPTNLLPPLHEDQPREPELLTHYEPLPGEPGGPPLAQRSEEPEAEAEPEPEDTPPTDEEGRRMRRKKIWRRVRRTCYVLVALGFVVPIAAFFIGYQMWDIPQPEQVALDQQQTVTFYYSDGQTELGKIVPESGARTQVKLDDIPKHVQNAVLAAENPTFWSDDGFSYRGIAGAVWRQIRGLEGGGSTITQQYIKVATGKDEKTYTRKFREIVLAKKMSDQVDKKTILEGYLNTIYFGRGAYGIQAAAKAYFGKDVKNLTLEEGAVLAGAIQMPSQWDPEVDLPGAKDRWDYVIKRMNEQGWLDGRKPGELQYPTTWQTADKWQNQGMADGPRMQIQYRAKAEVEKRYGWDQAQQQGLKIVTTIDAKAQQQLEDAVKRNMTNQPEELRTSAVSLDPKTGGVLAYYGSKDGKGMDYNWQGYRSPGSTFKPFVAIAGLKQGKGIGTTYDGTTPQKISGTIFRNAGDDARCGKECAVKDAMRMSINTAFVNMGVDVGLQNVAKAAIEAGIPEQYGAQKTLAEANGIPQAGLALGQYPVRPIDLATAFNTLAAEGTKHETHFVQKLVKPDGTVVAQFIDQKTGPAFDQSADKNQQIARNVTESMLQVASSSNLALKGNRQVASKTGTHGIENSDRNSDAWMAGYTPQVSTTVWVGTDFIQEIKWITPQGVKKDIYGKDLPGMIWRDYMNAYLSDKPVEKFSNFKAIGRAEPPPPPSPSNKKEETASHTPTSTPSSGTSPTPTSDAQVTSGKPPTTSCVPSRGHRCPPTGPTGTDDQDPGDTRNPNRGGRLPDGTMSPPEEPR
ncbi:Membrane carboxypeptidase (penicillin-binding protein) [Streptoalloteichus tenebrarius]|uniref:Membrane carboxypeptidase (Penicillin-binding protein) n=2 Tax=Streptoalloteichus tenebrarius (strain ATCC 17920 / DSM 40477 / JCM 4838 / CBS 697.72 / NBRC 16177 / NCIMB 11028 / NRRL B-12390 / A12253. 1 / ISP 5477) TaxID=1933 RepID=A0ABT1I120_STRSD|nr:Membrane carboxypeptidase (penicillin-binding protein) [Streptoalloteichus tenebrarius]